MSELYSYAHQTPVPTDSFSTKLTLSYLEASNKIFEQGLLSHEKVTSSDCQVVRNIQEGYQFFVKWLDEIYEKGNGVCACAVYRASKRQFYVLADKSFCATESTQKKFLSWQSENYIVLLHSLFRCVLFIAWDNLRIDVYGFVELTKHFLNSYPGYFLSPLRISGSAVESLFGQYKHMSGSKLDAVNYATCRSKYLAKQAVHQSGKFFRDQELNIPIAPLEKKKYNKK